MANSLETVKDNWNKFAARFTETANKRMTLQCSQHLHTHMQLDQARNVLEVAAGAGLGSLDIVQVMVDLAGNNLSGAGTDTVDIKCKEANGQDLTDVATASVDRYIASLCLQLAPGPDDLLREASRVLTADGIAGFTIWGSPERSGMFTITAAANKEMGFEENAGEHTNFAMGKDLPALRQRFAAAGFKYVQIWPYQCVVELWSGEDFATFHQEVYPLEDDELKAKRFAIVKRLADEWLAKGTPIGLETYIVLARK
ncbi:Methyltransferase domain [Phytophthora infestans]|uniref:Methyltransferase domain n=1 Tax=Phytophthora infestans TaxID=4787 RepID=A0A833WG62_PHYIN|nr:Methyltransferase domain [Phytophthora infestans]KAF4147992.1 Methyltransferase domain [Phytophthora infestans]